MALCKDVYMQHCNLIWIQKAFFNIQRRNRSYDSNCASNIRAWGFGDRLKKSNLISLIAFCHLIFNIIFVLNVPKELKTIKGCIFHFSYQIISKSITEQPRFRVPELPWGLRIQSYVLLLLFCILGWQEHDK